MEWAKKNHPEKKNQYVFPYNPSGFPLWVWAVILGLLFFLFVIGIYYASRGSGYGPQISNRQYNLSGGLLGTPGAF